MRLGNHFILESFKFERRDIVPPTQTSYRINRFCDLEWPALAINYHNCKIIDDLCLSFQFKSRLEPLLDGNLFSLNP